ncbi:hypothetical protein, partial [Faecalibacterium sp. An192]|uniref:hypothetical protein n=1 Tax=Faecalibacterium sp. An192 TaxID=1965581 RepID=UPI000B5597F8
PCETSQISKTSKTFDTFSYFLTGQYFFTVGGLWSAYIESQAFFDALPKQKITVIPPKTETVIKTAHEYSSVK